MGVTITNYACSSTEEHEGHPTEGTRSFTCNGEAPCGEKTHEPHRVTKEVELWCQGICKCGLRTGPHGPGDHK